MESDKNIEKIDFIGIGAPWCATSWLTFCLNEHPDIFIPTNYELNYFKGYKTNKGISEYELKGIRDYFNYFKGSKKGQIKGDMSTAYLFPEIAKIIKNNFPHVKIIISLRNPIDRALSGYNRLKNQNENYNQEKFLEDLPKLEREIINFNNFYFDQIKYYFDLFPKENIMVIIHNEIKKNPQDVIQKAYRFLGVNENFVPSLIGRRVNESKTIRYYFLNDFFKFIYKSSTNLNPRFRIFLKESLNMKGFSRMLYKKIILKKRYNKVDFDEHIKNKLIVRYKEDIKKTESLIGKRLLWT